MEFPVYQPFPSEWLTFVLFLLGILLVLGLAEWLRSRLNWSAETSRKTVHILVGVLIFWARFLFISPLPAITLALLFILINLLAFVRGGFQGMHSTRRKSLGTVFYPAAFLILVLIYWNRDPGILLISFLILALGDPLAAQVGETVAHPRRFRVWRDEKSVQGSLSLGIFATLLTVTGLMTLNPLMGLQVPSAGTLLATGIAVGIVSAAAESISWGGSDNLSLPLSAAITLDICLSDQSGSATTFLLWLLIAFILAYGAYRLKVLTLSGTMVAFLLGTFIFGIGGIAWMIPLGIFFLLSSLLSKLGGSRKASAELMYEKSGNRDMMQVLANGGVAGLLAIIWHYTQFDLLYLAFLGSLAAATADTWGTEIGVFSRRPPRSILTFRQVTMGTSGGITMVGTTGAALGSGILTLSGLLVPISTLDPLLKSHTFLAIAFAGVAGALFDSLLGATVQAQYYCETCGKITEKRRHCDVPVARLHQGFQWINNDVVNLACTSMGALLAFLLLG